MTTYYGLNPSFVYNSPLPLFANALRRGKRFEVCDAQGRPTGVESPVGADGLPLTDGRRHGVRVFAEDPAPADATQGVLVTRGGGGLTTASSSDWHGLEKVGLQDNYGPPPFHGPSVAALSALKPTVLRTLDLSKANLRPDWSRPRVKQADLLQGSDCGMAVELQAMLANRLNCTLWWNAPPRFELSVADYEVRLEELLTAIREQCTRAPVLELGNELWNTGFAAHGWLEAEVTRAKAGVASPLSWHDVAAQGIATLKRVADRVFGGHGPLGARSYYLFVGGQLTVPSHLDRILSALETLGVVPDLAGPALYVTPLKAHKAEWEATKSVPSQDELRSSCFARLEEIETGTETLARLSTQAKVVSSYGIPYFACYEAGQSLIAGAHPWRKAAIDAQKTEWMGELYRGIRRVAESVGVDLLNWYSAATDQTPGDTRVDVFGLLESTELTKMLPKALAARGD